MLIHFGLSLVGRPAFKKPALKEGERNRNLLTHRRDWLAESGNWNWHLVLLEPKRPLDAIVLCLIFGDEPALESNEPAARDFFGTGRSHSVSGE